MYIYIYMDSWWQPQKQRRAINWMITHTKLSFQYPARHSKGLNLDHWYQSPGTPCIWFCIKVSLSTIAVLVRMLLKCQPSWGLSTPQTPNRETQEVSISVAWRCAGFVIMGWRFSTLGYGQDLVYWTLVISVFDFHPLFTHGGFLNRGYPQIIYSLSWIFH